MNFIGGIPDGCKAFSNEECDYFGADTGFSTGPGHITDPVACQEHCRIFQVCHIKVLVMPCKCIFLAPWWM